MSSKTPACGAGTGDADCDRGDWVLETMGLASDDGTSKGDKVADDDADGVDALTLASAAFCALRAFAASHALLAAEPPLVRAPPPVEAGVRAGEEDGWGGVSGLTPTSPSPVLPPAGGETPNRARRATLSAD